MTNRIDVIGTGLGPEDLTARHLKIIREAHILVGGKRQLAWFEDHPGDKWVLGANLKALVAYLQRHMDTREIVVLASGDPLFYGIGAYLIKTIGPEKLRIWPNITTLAAAFARISQPWQDVPVLSFHGRGDPDRLAILLDQKDTLAVFTDPNHHPGWVGTQLMIQGVAGCEMCVLERLGSPEERIRWLSPSQAADATFTDPNFVIIRRQLTAQPDRRQPCLGMPDHWFAHEKGLITKSEVRAVALAKLRLMDHQVLWDLGAGSGSVSIEAAVLMPHGAIYAVEKDPNRIIHLKVNKQQVQVERMKIVQGNAPECLDSLPDPDRIFIGGGGRHLGEIIRQAVPRLKTGGRIVINTVLLANIDQAVSTLDGLGLQPEVTQVQISRSKPMPWNQRLESLNPVWIISAGLEP